MIEIKVNNSIASVQATEPLYTGAPDEHTCHFTFDPSWDGFAKSAVFRFGNKSITVLVNEDGHCTLPWEILTRANIGLKVEIGVYGVSSTKEVITSIWDDLGDVKDGTEFYMDARRSSPDVYDQVMASVTRMHEKVEDYTAKMTGMVQSAESVVPMAVSCAEKAAGNEADARNAATKAQEALASLHAALDQIPDGDTVVVNDLTTGGAAAALSAEMGKRLAERKPRNLMDNSYLVRPVNQRGETLYPAGSARYTIDRWRAVAGIAVSIHNRFVRIENTYSGTNGITQWIAEENGLKSGDTFTLACEDVNGNVYVGSKVLPESGTVTVCYLGSSSVGSLQIRPPDDTHPYFYVTIMLKANQSVDLKWIALYEGEYTVDTLPPYQPKAYEAELRECQRYFRNLNMRANPSARPFDVYATGASTAAGTLVLPVAMRAIPVVTWGERPLMIDFTGTTDADGFVVVGGAEITEISVADETSDLDRLRLNVIMDSSNFSMVTGKRYEVCFGSESTVASANIFLDANL